MLSGLWNLLFFAVALGILISIHELGHFLAARWCGVKVLRFSIGFGPVLFARTLKDGCQFALSAIPLGGYVKMQGEGNTDTTGASQDTSATLSPDAFLSKSLKQRALIIGAGPAFNIVLAFILYVVVNLMGVSVLRPIIGDVMPGSRAAAAGLTLYDEIKAIDGSAVHDWSEAAMLLVSKVNSSSPLSLQVAADLGHGATRQVNLSLEGISLTPGVDPLSSLGLRPCAGKVTDTLTTVQPQGPAYAAGLSVGDKIVRVNGVVTPNWYRVQDAVAVSKGPLKVEVERNGDLYQAEIYPQTRCRDDGTQCRPFIGVGVAIEPIAGLMTTKSYGPLEALAQGAAATARMSLFIVTSTYKLIAGEISADNISGPIAIAKGAGQSASFGFVFFLSFLAAISVNLGILNLLPIPVLDGGQLLFIAYEALTGRAPSPRVQYALTVLGLCCIITLSLFAVFNDLRAL